LGLGFRIEELSGCGDRFGGGFLVFLTSRLSSAAPDASLSSVAAEPPSR